MAKAKSRLFTAGTQPFYSHSPVAPAVSGLDLALALPMRSVVLKTKPTKKLAQSEAQIARQDEWKEVDCMWKTMTTGQRALWSSFYYEERDSGKTVKTTTENPPATTGAFKSKDMGQMGYFFHKALLWDLLDYLASFLGAEWYIENRYDAGSVYVVEARIITADQLDEILSAPTHQLVRGMW